jgi:hypothetical protein
MQTSHKLTDMSQLLDVWVGALLDHILPSLRMRMGTVNVGRRAATLLAVTASLNLNHRLIRTSVSTLPCMAVRASASSVSANMSSTGVNPGVVGGAELGDHVGHASNEVAYHGDRGVYICDDCFFFDVLGRYVLYGQNLETATTSCHRRASE